MTRVYFLPILSAIVPATSDDNKAPATAKAFKFVNDYQINQYMYLTVMTS